MHSAAKNMDPRWFGETVVCIASGPSLTQEDLDVVRAQHARGLCRVIAINREFEFAPWADVLYMADYRCWKTYIADVREKFKGELWTLDAQAARELKLNLIQRGYGSGYSQEPRTLNTGGNSGFQALHLAVYWGAARVALLGYDMQATEGKKHHFGEHRDKLPGAKGFGSWITRFAPLMRDLNRMGVDVTNLTRDTALPKQLIKRSTVEEFAWLPST